MNLIRLVVLCCLALTSFSAFAQEFPGFDFIADEGADCSLPPPENASDYNLAVGATTDQNTVDTQAKLSIGDVDCDGIPDVIFVSKWNQTIRVMATTDGQLDGSDEGDIKSDFKTPGKNIFPKGKDFASGWYFEFEIAIGNIDGTCEDGDPAEMFSFASNRQNPNDDPENYVLTGFTYQDNTLEYLSGWCSTAPVVSTQRPGELALADFDGDGLVEIFFKNVIYAAETGCFLAQGDPTLDWDTEVNSAPVAVDIIPGGNLELVSGNIIYQVPDLTAARNACASDPCNASAPANLTVAYDMNTLGQGMWFPKEVVDIDEYQQDNFSSTSVADVNNDGNLDIVLSGALDSKDGKTAIFYWDFTNGIVDVYLPTDGTDPLGWKWGTSRPNLGDIDGDGKLEITIVSGSTMYALEEVGGVLVEKWTRQLNDSRSGIIATTVYDFDNDGSPEIVYRDAAQIAIIDGETGQETLWATKCESHTMSEGPIIADIDGNGSTDLCVPCNTNNSFKVDAGIQQQALGQMSCWTSGDNAWLPTRQVWNMGGYFVTNINDDLTVPNPQVGMSTVLGTNPCPNGLPGPQKPFNTFLNQIPYLGPDGCPYYPGADLEFFGFDPDNPTPECPDAASCPPLVNVIPPVCGNRNIIVEFNIINSGDIPLTEDVSVTFWNGDPSLQTGDGSAVRLFVDTLNIVALDTGQTLSIPSNSFNGPGTIFNLYIVLNDASVAAPIDLEASSDIECSLVNNMVMEPVIPTPFEVTVSTGDNFQCEPDAPPTGQATPAITRFNPQTLQQEVVTDFSGFSFQYYTGSNADAAIPAADGGTQTVLSGVLPGDYSLIVTENTAGCTSDIIPFTILDGSPQPDITIEVVSDQDQCFPPNGEMRVVFGSTSTGYTFEWYNQNDFLTVLGTAQSIGGLQGGAYSLVYNYQGCTGEIPATILDLSEEPEPQAFLVNGVTNCADPNSGSVTALAFQGGVEAANQADYSFDWYFTNDGINPGSILPPENGTGATRTGLAAGTYLVRVTNELTQCPSPNYASIEVPEDFVFPNIQIIQLAPQTSCINGSPNGALEVQILDPNNPGNFLDPTPYNIEWFRGANTLPANLHTSVAGVNGEQATAVEGGGIPYTAKVTTTEGCFTTADFVIEEFNEPPVVTLVELTPNRVCDPVLASLGQYTGSIEATVSDNGNAITFPSTDFTFRWYEGQTTGGNLVATNTSPTLDGLQDGYYTLEVEKNGVGCISEPVTVLVGTEAGTPILVDTITPATNCPPTGQNNGSATILVDEAGNLVSSGYVYEWFIGTDTSSTTGVQHNILSGTNNETAEQLAPGTQYTAVVRDPEIGCLTVYSFTVPDESTLPSIAASVSDNTICDANLNYGGSITATVTDDNNPNGNPVTDFTDYSFYWKQTAGDYTNLASATDIPNAVFDTNNPNILSQIPGGTYELAFTNNLLGCSSDTLIVQVADLTELPAVTISAVDDFSCAPAFATGELTANVSEANPPVGGYEYTWTVDGSNPVINVGNTQTITGIEGGLTYRVDVRNPLTGCELSQTYALPNTSSLPEIILVGQENSICDNNISVFNGRIEATVNDPNVGGSPVTDFTNYTFNWEKLTGDPLSSFTGVDNSQPNILANVPEGDYRLTVSNNVGCVSQPVTITILFQPLFPDLLVDTNPSTNCDGPDNGTLIAEVNDPVNGVTTTGYTFNWYSGNVVDAANFIANTATVANQPGGQDYIVEVINDATGCVSTEVVTLDDASSLPLLTLIPTENGICGGGTANFNGSIAATVDDPNGDGVPVTDFTDYTFTWAQTVGDYVGQNIPADIPGATLSSPNILSNIPNGTYQVTVRNTALGCTSLVEEVVIGYNPTSPTIAITPTPSTNCTNGATVTPDGQLTASINGGAPASDFRLRWFAGNSTAGTPLTAFNDQLTATQLQGGSGVTYTLEVKNLLTGCINTETVLLQDASELHTIQLDYITENEICDENIGFTGEISITVFYKGADVTNSTDYYYRWYTGQSVSGTPIFEGVQSSILTSQEAGFFTVQVENTVLGCISDPITIELTDDQYFPVLDASVVNQTSCNLANPNGQVTVTIDDSAISGTNDPSQYDFVWEESNDGITYTALSPGILPLGSGETISQLPGNTYYRATVTRTATGCSNEISRFVPEIIQFPDPDLTLVSSMTNCGTPNGALFASVAGVELGYDFYWFDGTSYDAAEIIGATTDADPSTNGAVISDDGNYTGLFAGLYSLVVIDRSTGCQSEPEVIEVPDATTEIQILAEVTDFPADCNANNGEITVTFLAGSPSLNPADYQIDIYLGQPTNDGVYDLLTGPDPTFTAGTLPNGAPNNIIDGLTSDIHTIVITYLGGGSATSIGCQYLESVFVPFADAHTISLDSTNSAFCDESVGNGTMQVTAVTPDPTFPARTNPGDYTFQVYKNDDPLNLLFDDGGNPATAFPSLSNLGPGIYTVVSRDLYTGATCPVYTEFEILHLVSPPILNIVGTLRESTTCGIVVGDGSATISFSRDSDDSSTDEYELSVTPVGATPAPGGATYPRILAPTESPYDISNLSQGTYTVSLTGYVGGVLSGVAGCTVVREITIGSNPLVAEIVDSNIDVVNSFYCTPSGSITVNDVRIVGSLGQWDAASNYEIGDRVVFNDAVYRSLITPNQNLQPDINGAAWVVEGESLNDYRFDWYNSSPTATSVPIFSALGNVGALPSDPPPGQRLDSIAFPTIAPGDYWVIATKETGAGAGCSSAPLKKTILDVSTDPTITLVAGSNTSCTPGTGEGTITITANTSAGPGANPSDTYSYVVLDPSNTPVVLQNPTGNVGDGGAAGTNDSDVIEGLEQGTYTVTATNETTNCSVTQQVTILFNTTPIFILDVVVTNPQICDPDGSLFVTDVSYDDSTPASKADFSFEWYEGDPNGAPLVDSNGDAIITDLLEAGTGPGQYPALDTGAYYVVAVAQAPPGLGCKSAPFRRNLVDESTPPSMAYTTTDNTACIPLGATGEITITMDGGGTGNAYDYTWVSATDPDGNLYDLTTDASMPVDLDDFIGTPSFGPLQSGTYVVLVEDESTGCTVQRTIIVNESIILPKISNISSTPNNNCGAPNGSLTIETGDVIIDGAAIPITELIVELFSTSTVDGSVPPVRTDPGETSPGSGVKEWVDLAPGTYYLSVTRNGGASLAGEGCPSSPVEVKIITQEVLPTLTSSVVANNNCEGTNYNGDFSITYTLPTGAVGTDGTYNLTFDTMPAGAVIEGNATAPFTLSNRPVVGGTALFTPTDATSNIAPGTYEYTAFNVESGCQISSTLVVPDQPVTPVTLAFTPTNQTNCGSPNGSIIVQASDIVISGNPLADLSEVTLSLNELEDGTGQDFPAVDVNDNTQRLFSNLVFGTYYLLVSVNSDATIAGAGCNPVPLAIPLDDQTTLPNVQFTTSANTSCTITDPTGTMTISITEQTLASSYTIVWDSAKNADGPIPLPDVANSTANDAYNSEWRELAHGTYYLTIVNDDTDCFTSVSRSISNNPIFPQIPALVPDPQTFCEANGSLTIDDGDITIDGVPINVSELQFDLFDLDGNQYTNVTTTPTSITFIDLQAGEYDVSVRRANGGSVTGEGCPSDPFRIIIEDQITPPTMTVTKDNSTSCQDQFANGTLDATVNDINPGPFTFDWQYKQTEADPFGALPAAAVRTDGATNSNLTDLQDGIYLITIRNTTTLCEISEQRVIETLNPDFPNVINVDVNTPTTCNGSDAIAEVTEIKPGSTGTTITDPARLDADFTYTWYRDSVDATTLINETSRRLDGTLGNYELPPGSYFVVIFSQLTGCEGIPYELVITDDNIITPNVQIVQSIPQIGCLDPFTAELVGTVDGGIDDQNAPADYIWRWTKDGTDFATTSTISQLDEGRYKLYVQNVASGCLDSAEYIVENQSLEFGPVIDVRAVSNTNCDDNTPSGELMVTITDIPNYPDALKPFDYSIGWWPGTSPDFNTAPTYTTATVNGVPHGTYTVQVIDNNSQCNVTGSITVGDERNPPVVVIIQENPDTKCDPVAPNGQLRVIVDNNDRPYTDFDIAWHSGSDTSTPIITTQPILIGQQAGTYTVSVVDRITNCSIELQGEIIEGQVDPPSPDPVVLADNTNCPPLGPNGIITVTVDGEISGYDFQWYDGQDTSTPLSTNVSLFDLPAGFYTVTARDQVTGCISPPATIEVVDDLTFPEVRIFTEPSICSPPPGLAGTGSAVLEITNGVNAVSFTWTNLADNSTHTGQGWYDLAAGQYEVTIVTTTGCELTTTAEVETTTQGFQLVTPGKSTNNFFYIDCIENFPDNNVKIFQRTGVMVYEANGYDNFSTIFTGVGRNGLYFLGKDVPDGTYFYIVDRGDGSKPETGFIEILRN